MYEMSAEGRGPQAGKGFVWVLLIGIPGAILLGIMMLINNAITPDCTRPHPYGEAKIENGKIIDVDNVKRGYSEKYF
jgi:hypothetical protein